MEYQNQQYKKKSRSPRRKVEVFVMMKETLCCRILFRNAVFFAYLKIQAFYKYWY